jgi:hypothetical protein
MSEHFSEVDWNCPESRGPDRTDEAKDESMADKLDNSLCDLPNGRVDSPDAIPMLVSTAVHVEGPTNTQVTSIEGTLYESSMITNLTIEMTQIPHGQLVGLNPGEE